MGLNESFATARGQILMMNPLPTISQAYCLVKQEERQRQGHIVSNSFIANAKTGAQNPNSGKSFNQSDNAIGVKRKCTYCQKDGHTRDVFFKLIGYLPKGRGKGKFSPTNNFSLKNASPAMHASTMTGSYTPGIKNAGASGISQNQTQPGFQQQSLDQLQNQVNQLMAMMITKGPAVTPSLNTPEEHIGNMAGLVFSMLSSVPSTLHFK